MRATLAAYSLVTISLCLLITCARCFGKLDFNLHSYENMTAIFTEWKIGSKSNEGLHWNLTSIGKSVCERDIWVFEVSATPRDKPGTPNVKLIGDMHSNYPAGKEILLHFIDFLMSSYGKDQNVTRLLDTTRIYVVPSMNPDGNTDDDVNARDIDLNTNFPDYYHKNPQDIQPETAAIMNWMEQKQFSLSANLDGGGVVAYYPLNSLKEYKSFQGPQESLAEDNDVFVYLANLYSRTHKTMHEGKPCEDKHGEGIEYPSYPGGIVNGAITATPDKESLTGTMQDYNYFKHGCMELHLKITCDDREDRGSLERIWNQNKEALVQYCLQANRGVHGFVKDIITNAPVKARLKIDGRNVEFHTGKNGEFYRILLPGTYQLKVNSDGYYQQSVSFTIPEDAGIFPELVRLDIGLLNSSIPTTPVTVQTSSFTEQISVDVSTISAEQFDEPNVAGVTFSTACCLTRASSLLFSICLLVRPFIF